MCPLTLKLIFKVARCVGDHVGTPNSEDGSSGAEEIFVYLVQMLRFDV
jgi:hypothetical protein